MKLLILIPALLLTGCASTDYAQYTASQQAIAASKAQADTARYQALADIAKNGTDSSKVAAVMALAMGGGQSATVQVAAPQRSEALMWASIIVPGLTQAWAISKNADVAMNSSNNAAATSMATTQGFVSMGAQIQAPAANVDNSQTMSGTGVLGSGSYNTEANPINNENVVVPPVVVVPDTVIVPPVVVGP
jgi:hypothetical protein